ncbi:hypothetical protein [Agromyces lapidis]|uniref:Lipoprotein n=1 Tax=Agromyces lapidis TaxID=279574 RepID=A0ABV5SLY9_9MICO|nr:hypothetical protein [Agromyces lapidis]
MSIPSTRVVALAAAGALALVLSACTPEAEPAPEPTATASTAPIFASDEEALAAAVEAYEAYAAASDAIAADGGAGPERIDAFVTSAFAEILYEEFRALRTAGGHLEGSGTFDTVSLAQHEQVDGAVHVTLYFCQDVTNVRAISADGKDVTPASRPDRVPSQGNFVTNGLDPDALVVDGITQWSGSDFC